MYLDAVIKVALKHHPDKGVQLNYTNNAPLMHNSRHKLERSTIVQNLAYADDIMLTCSNIESLQCVVKSFSDIFAKFLTKN